MRSIVERDGTSQERDRRKGTGREKAGKTGKGYVIDELLIHWRFLKLCFHMEKVWVGKRKKNKEKN